MKMRIEKTSYIYVALILALFALAPHPAHAGDILTVKAEGTAPKSAGAEDSRKAAVDQALRNSVIEAATVIMKDEGMEQEGNGAALESEVYSKPLAYILNYRILAEGPVSPPAQQPPAREGAQPPSMPNVPPPAPEEVYSVWLEAVVDAGTLRSALGQLIAASGKGSLSNISIIVLDVPDYDAFKSVKAALENIPALKDVSYNSFSRGRAVLSARASSAAQSLTERVSKDVGDGFAVFAPDRSTIVIKAIPVGASIAR